MEKFLDIFLLRFIDDKNYKTVIAFVLMILMMFIINIDRKHSAERDLLQAKIGLTDKMHVQILSILSDQSFESLQTAMQQYNKIIAAYHADMFDILDASLTAEQHKALVRKHAAFEIQMEQIIILIEQQRKTVQTYYDQLLNKCDNNNHQ